MTLALPWLAGVLVAAIVPIALIPVLDAWARRRKLLDVPNDRSSHLVPTPRVGGVAIVLAVTLGVASVAAAEGVRVSPALALVLGSAGIMGILGFVDDLVPLPPWVRLLVQTAVACFIVAKLGAIPVSAGFAVASFDAAITVVWIVGFTNAYNFMDGVDGIAGTQACLAGLAWVGIGWFSGARDATLLGLMIGVASGTFLAYNWQPARVFMGDGGSAFLGFLLATLPLTSPAGRLLLWICAVAVLWPFVFDTTVTLIRRAWRRENIFAAHRSHLYQRLTKAGWSHGEVSRAYGGFASLGVPPALALAAGRDAVAGVLAFAIPVAGAWLWRTAGQPEWGTGKLYTE